MRKCFVMMVAIMLAGCEKMVLDEDVKNGNVVMRVTRAGGSLGDACTRLNVAVFDENGQKVKTVSQTLSDDGFGTVGLSLPPETYGVAMVAHSCAGAATVTSADKVTFPSNKVTDTFCWYGTIDANENKQNVNINLQRCVAMVRLHISSERDDIASLKFYYLGGSSTLSVVDGYGAVNSKQTEYRTWNNEGVYELYTIPHADEDVITKMIITAMDASDNVVGEYTLEDIPVRMNHITEYEGDLFGTGGGVSLVISVNPQWSGVMEYEF